MTLRRLRPLLAVALIAALSGCSPLYLLRGGLEEAKLLWRREPIADLLADPALTPAARRKLELVLAVREFARDRLGLDVGGSYTTVATIKPEQVVHVVTAAERFQLVAYRWWFPLVGNVPYKGFFDRGEAQREAAELAERGYDSLVRSAAAFSTLGWFDDPLPRYLLDTREVELANVVIHELLHGTVYLAGEAEFNESFANFVGQRGAIAFFEAQADLEARRQAELAWQQTLAYSGFLEQLTGELRQAYASGITLAQRQQRFRQAQEELRGLGLADKELARGDANNAVLLHELLYNDRLRLFEAVWRAHQGDLGATIAAVVAATGSGDPFDHLGTLASQP